ncbi:uncharacterized protein LOC120140781 [Hibiscus syriacus]|nr:uncharacterized protein LOC120140781 [Hibiscus syriacus]
MAASNGDWRWQEFDYLLPLDVILRITVIKTPENRLSCDTIGWRCNINRTFSVKPAYKLNVGSESEIRNPLWNANQRFRACDTANKDVGHVLKWCPLALQNQPANNDRIITCSRRLVELSVKANSEENVVHSRVIASVDMNIRWNPPTLYWIKINMDGARCSATGHASCAGVARNDNGDWCFGFNKFIGICSILDVELWAAYYGLRLAWAAGYHHIILELDSMSAIRVIKYDQRNKHSLRWHLEELWNRDWTIQIEHNRREGNKIVDALAKKKDRFR